jgi:hypothetical protein
MADQNVVNAGLAALHLSQAIQYLLSIPAEDDAVLPGATVPGTRVHFAKAAFNAIQEAVRRIGQIEGEEILPPVEEIPDMADFKILQFRDQETLHG